MNEIKPSLVDLPDIAEISGAQFITRHRGGMSVTPQGVSGIVVAQGGVSRGPGGVDQSVAVGGGGLAAGDHDGGRGLEDFIKLAGVPWIAGIRVVRVELDVIQAIHGPGINAGHGFVRCIVVFADGASSDALFLDDFNVGGIGVGVEIQPHEFAQPLGAMIDDATVVVLCVDEVDLPDLAFL